MSIHTETVRHGAFAVMGAAIVMSCVVVILSSSSVREFDFLNHECCLLTNFADSYQGIVA